MSWIFLTGIDKINKKRLSDHFVKKGFVSVDVPIPNKKYLDINYAGPTYADEILELYLKYDGQDIVWDRTPHEEHMWSTLYGLKVLIPKEDLDEFVGIGQQNEAIYYLVQDDDVNEQWKRCVQAKEITSKEDFRAARLLFERMAQEFGFVTVSNMDEFMAGKTTERQVVIKKHEEEGLSKMPEHTMTTTSEEYMLLKTPEQLRLEEANAISSLLDKRILKKTGEYYDGIENEVRDFLNTKLSILLGVTQSDNPVRGLTAEEISLVKVWLKAFKEKMKK